MGVQPPGDVGILGGVGGGTVEGHFGKADRLLAGAAQVLEGDGGVAEVALRKLVHPVSAPDPVLAAPGVEIEADHHRVVDRADRDSLPGDDVEVILAVLEDLEDRFVLQQRLQRGDGIGHRHLLRLFGEHVRPAVAKRDIAGIIGPERQAHADELGLHRIERSRLGIDRHHLRRAGAGDPGFEPLDGLHRLIGRVIDCREIGERLAVAFALRWGGSAGSGGLGRVEIGGARGAAVASVEPPQKRGEAVGFEKQRKRRRRDRPELHFLERLGEVAILLERYEHLGKLGIGAAFDQAVAQLGELHALRAVERGGERAVFGDQLAGGLGADAEDAGHVVDRIAHQRQHVAHQFGADTELLLDLGKPDALVLHRVEHIDAGRAVRRVDFGDQLHQVLVGTDDGDVPAAFLRAAGIGGDEIVGLQPRHLDAGQAEGAGRVADQRELRLEVFGRLGPVGLVVLVDVVAEALAAGVEDHGKVGRAVGRVEIGRELPQHRGVAIDRAHRSPFGVRQRGQAVIGPEDVGRPVDEVEMLLIGHAAC